MPYWPLILLLAIIKFVLPLFLQHPLYELHRDEYLYYQQGQHLALGYMENPPLLSWLGHISSWFGGSPSWIKLWPSLFGAGTVVIACLIAAELGGKLFAQFIAGISIMTGAFMRMHYLFQPNAPDIFFWTLALYFLIRCINEQQDKWLYGFFISLALGWWSKYSVVFVGAAICLSLLLSQHRIFFTKKKFYAGATLALLLILPNIWWQYSHRWPVIHHMQELQDTQLKYLNPIDFIKEQFMLLMPVAFIWIAGLIGLLRNKQWRFLAFTYFLVLALLLLGSGKAYYAVGIYPMLLAAGAVVWENISAKKTWIRYAISIFIIGFTWLIAPLLLPDRQPAELGALHRKMGVTHKWEDLKEHDLPQDFADMLGWKELAQKAEAAYNKLPAEQQANTLVYCRNYGQAGALKYYGNKKEFTSKVISDNGSFLHWIPDSFPFQHLLFVGRRLPDKDDEVFQHFQKVSIIDSVVNPYSRQLGDKIILFEHVDSTGLQLAQEGIREMKNQFRR